MFGNFRFDYLKNQFINELGILVLSIFRVIFIVALVFFLLIILVEIKGRIDKNSHSFRNDDESKNAPENIIPFLPQHNYVITDLTTTEKKLIELLQKELLFLTGKNFELIVVSDISKVNNLMWEKHFVITKEQLTIQEKRYHDLLESEKTPHILEMFMTSYSGNLANAKYNHCKF